MSRTKIFAILGAFIVLSIVLAVSGCTGSQSVTSTPTPEATPTITPTTVPTPTVTPVSTSTPAPTATPAPTVTPVPTTFAPTQSPTSNYSWPGFDYHWSTTSTPDGEPVLLMIDGEVDNPLSLTLADLQAYPQYAASMTLIDGTVVSGTGPLLIDLLNAAQPIDYRDWMDIEYINGTLSSKDPITDLQEPGTLCILAIDNNNKLELIVDGSNELDGRLNHITRITIVQWYK